jgi:hypothetical protein
MADKLPNIIIRPGASQKIRDHCGVKHDMDLAEHIGLHRAQIGRVLSGKHAPGNRFIAGVIERCGLKFAFEQVFDIVPDEPQEAARR